MDGLVTALREIKKQALEEHNMDIAMALVGVADFFNRTLRSSVQNDLYFEADVDSHIYPRTSLSYMKNPDVVVPRGSRVLVLDQEYAHSDMAVSQN